MVLPAAERERENRCKESPILCTIAVKLNAVIKKQQRNICINIFPTWITLESASALGCFRYSSRWGVCARQQWKNWKSENWVGPPVDTCKAPPADIACNLRFPTVVSQWIVASPYACNAKKTQKPFKDASKVFISRASSTEREENKARKLSDKWKSFVYAPLQATPSADIKLWHFHEKNYSQQLLHNKNVTHQMHVLFLSDGTEKALLSFIMVSCEAFLFLSRTTQCGSREIFNGPCGSYCSSDSQAKSRSWNQVLSAKKL